MPKTIVFCFDRVDVRLLPQRLGTDDPTARREDRLAEHLRRTRAALGLQDAARGRHVRRTEAVAGLRHREQFVDEAARGGDGSGIAREGDLVAAHVHVDIGVLALDDAQQPVLRAEQLHHRDAVGIDALDGVVRLRIPRARQPPRLDSSRSPARTWACTWKTVCPAPAPVLKTRRKSPSECSAATEFASPTSSASRSGVTRGEFDDVAVLLRLRDHQQVHRSFGCDVADGERVLGLGDDLGRDLALQDAGEDRRFAHDLQSIGGVSRAAGAHQRRRAALTTASAAGPAVEVRRTVSPSRARSLRPARTPPSSSGRDPAFGADDEDDIPSDRPHRSPSSVRRRGAEGSRTRTTDAARTGGQHGRGSRAAATSGTHARCACFAASRTIDAHRARPFGGFGGSPSATRCAPPATARSHRRRARSRPARPARRDRPSRAPGRARCVELAPACRCDR